MSKGLSWHQVSMIYSIGRQIRKGREHRERKNAWLVREGRAAVVWPDKPVAWRAIGYGPTDHDLEMDRDEARVSWNIEQALRRSLRSLERRGLVTLGRYCFRPYPDTSGTSAHIAWSYTDRGNHVTGETRIMTGVLLTEAGWAIADAERARINKLRAKNAGQAARLAAGSRSVDAPKPEAER